MAESDSGYKLLFSHPELVADLLRGFVPEPWVAEVDFATLTPVKGSYVSDDLRQRHDDVVWKVRLRDQWLYVYVIIEFQSEPDPFMALRLLVYVGLLYQDLLRRNELPADGRLPPVLPVVLYNGTASWTGAVEFRELLTPTPPGLERYQPRFQYLLLDEERYPQAALAGTENLAAALFRLDRSRSRDELQAVVDDLLAWLATPERRSLRRAFGIWLRRAFGIWLRRVFLRRRLPGAVIPEIDDLREVKAMLAERWEQWTREWEQRGLQQGLQQGEVRLLLKLLRQRFGELPPWVMERLAAAETTQLETWVEELFSAASVEELLGRE